MDGQSISNDPGHMGHHLVPLWSMLAGSYNVHLCVIQHQTPTGVRVGSARINWIKVVGAMRVGTGIWCGPLNLWDVSTIYTSLIVWQRIDDKESFASVSTCMFSIFVHQQFAQDTPYRSTVQSPILDTNFMYTISYPIIMWLHIEACKRQWLPVKIRTYM